MITLYLGFTILILIVSFILVMIGYNLGIIKLNLTSILTKIILIGYSLALIIVVISFIVKLLDLVSF